MEVINNYWAVISGIGVVLVYTWILVWYISSHQTKAESRNDAQDTRITNLEKENEKHQESYKSGDEKLWIKINEVEKKIDLFTANIQAQLMLIQGTLGKIEGRMESRKR